MHRDKVKSSKMRIIRSDPDFSGSARNFNVAHATGAPRRTDSSANKKFKTRSSAALTFDLIRCKYEG